MKLISSEQAWEDYLYWQKTDKKMVQRINGLIKEITRTPHAGTGKP
ncbi:type II toxin-antitoxin system YoeB family toxin, partial [Salmonella enterica subsp. enterica serovar Typhimurium]|nr:type II toxin-antitoxin system YoeB family toxin [Salmonella enterica subsp. enterica serovar Typhimurium]